MSAKHLTLKERIAQSHRNAVVLIEGCAKQYAAGDKGALLTAINWCAAFGVPIPTWGAKAFCEAFRSTIWDFEHRSWDEVFGKPHPDRKLRSHKQQHVMSWDVYWRVRQLRDKKPKPRDIFASVGREFKISAATAKRYFDARSRWLAEAWADRQERERQ